MDIKTSQCLKFCNFFFTEMLLVFDICQCYNQIGFICCIPNRKRKGRSLMDWIWIFCCILIGIFLKLYLWGPGKGSTVCKAAATFVSVCISFSGALYFGGWFWTVCIAAFLCMVADIWIQYSLIPGVLVFLSAHLFFIAWMFFSGGQLGWNLLFSAIVCGFLLWGYRRWLKAFGSQSLFLSVYLFILLCMAFTAASIPFTRQSAGVWMLLAGALCFVASDLILGASIITGKKSEWKDKAVMLLYEPAVFLLTLSVFYQ